ncbi:MAG: ABC transporter permease, partial [Candidatus Rokuibacteriota bacterium]
IASILAILLVIAIEVYPLFKAPSASAAGSYPPAKAAVPARGDSVGVDEYREVGFVVTRTGAIALVALGGQGPMAGATAPGLGGATVTTVAALGKDSLLLGTSDGRALPLSIKFDVAFRDGRRTVTPQSEFGAPVNMDPGKNRAIARLTGAVTGRGPVTIAQVGRTTLAIHSVAEKKSLIGPTGRQESSASLEVPFDGEITALRLDGRGEDLFIGTSRGQLVWYDMRNVQEPRRAGAADAGEAPITALGLLIGDRTLVVGDGQGGVSTWQLVPGLGGGERREDPERDDERHEKQPGDDAFDHRCQRYEGYSEPAWVWQSTGGTDDFEAKLSLTPLVYGTLKGTFYALLFAVPIALLAAVYVSEFMHPAIKNYVKPVVEIMAALPSVVLGFFAGLWLAPVVERVVPGLFLMPFVVALGILAALAGWRAVPATIRGRVRSGTEMLMVLPVVVAGAAVALALGGLVERTLLGGNYRGWLLTVLGLTYDQRNSLVVGIAMGFAVIPIIFTIAEDSLANVPQHLRAGSFALGANRWQTAIRIVLPTASPGIFSAIMIGFGRAVGETMIVLMATGNTPVMDWSIFNGFRALSANIAVELPEAPDGGTLFRVLFLAAFLLFCLTFVVNTVAELVRLKLRQRYRYL